MLRPNLIYGSESQTETIETKQRLRPAEMCSLRSILGYHMQGWSSLYQYQKLMRKLENTATINGMNMCELLEKRVQ